MDELRRELAELIEARDAMKEEMEATPDASKATKKAFEFGVREIQKQIDSLKAEIENAEERERVEKFDESPEGQLLHAVAWEFQYDHYESEHGESIMEGVRAALAQNGLRLTLEKVDG